MVDIRLQSMANSDGAISYIISNACEIHSDMTANHYQCYQSANSFL